MGRWLAENHYLPDRIIASPSARTTETVELVCAALMEQTADPKESKAGCDIDQVIYDQRLYHGGATQICAIARQQLQPIERVLVVAHNPGMEQAVLAYCPSAQPFADGKLMPTCALAVIAWDGEPNPGVAGGGQLRALLRPSEL